ncbi:MAG: hypothetical protein ABSE49_26360, partial [Polyangiaceae bacterium]
MPSASSFARSIAYPPLVGAAYVLVLAAWAAQSPTVDERAGGAQARQIQAVVEGRFGGEIGRVGIAIVATAILVGALLGWAAWALVLLRDRIHEPAVTRSVLRETGLLIVLVAALHGATELWGMAHDPSLYADAWYARGGLRRTVQVLATDVLGPSGVVLFALVVLALLLFRIPTASAGPAADDAHPNVVILAADSLRDDRLEPRTAPHLSALA